jgi:hypothetical protein
VTTPIHTGRAHSTLGASIAERWMACPGSVALSASVPPLPSTAFADEGTAAHELCERALREHWDCADYVGQRFGPAETLVDEWLAADAQVFVDYVRQVCADAGAGHTLWLEKRFDLADLRPPAPMYGTGDAVVYDPAAQRLHIIDLKFGRGVAVEARGNKQLRYYGLGATMAVQAESPALAIDSVRITIVQPRMNHPEGPVRSEDLSYADLLGFADDLLAAAWATQASDAPLAAGKHCRFCPAGGVCPEQFRAAQDAAAVEFADLPAVQPPAPATLPDDLFFEVLEKVPILEAWIRAVHAERDARLARGETVPGWKVVAKRATRKWTDPEAVAQRLLLDGYDADELYAPRELKSVAQMEKVATKQWVAANLADLIDQTSSGTSVVRETDPRPAVAVSAGDEFLAIPAGE